MEIKSGLYQHFKGGTVRVLGLAKSSQDGEEPRVIYVGLQDGQLCARPLSSFNEMVKNKEGNLVPRFVFKEIRPDLLKDMCKE